MEVKKILKDKSGNFLFWAVVIVLSLLIVATSGFEYMRLQIIAQGVRDSVQTVITQSCTTNYNKLYNGLREGYSGGYNLDGGDWSEDIDIGDIEILINKQLGTQKSGSGYVKYNGDKVEFEISDLSVKMTNTPFAPGNPEKEKKFTGVATFNLTVPLSFGWQSLPPMEINMKVVSGYTAKF